MKVMTKKVPEWESELWSYISKSDGVTCPLYGVNKARHCGDWCFNKNREMFIGLHSIHGIGSSNDESEPGIFNRLDEHIFPRHWKPGRIFQLVEALANKFIKKATLTQPPIITELITQFDINPRIEIRPLPLKAYHGAVWQLKDGWVIHLNSEEKPARQRATLFHEVFHILAHSRSAPVFKKRESKTLFNETLADYFAYCALMPRE